MDGPPGFRRPSRQQVTKILKESVKTGHPTGLPERLLRLFAPNQPLPAAVQKPHKRPALPYTGVAQYLENFAEPGTEEYEPPRPAGAPSSPRLYRNREFCVQVRLDKETKEEKCVDKAVSSSN
jgi:U1 small nuclear ribonucleoprotein